MAKKHLIVIGGPTASGKTDWAIRMAQHFQTEILSCDSRQFYREMDIGTAKPAPEELQEVPHHFISNLSIHDRYSVGDFEREAMKLLDELFQKHDLVILTGGSGLYIKALCEGLDEFPEVPSPVREEVEQLYQQKGLDALREELQRADPDYYAEVDLYNPARLIRALSVCRTSGRPFSSFRRAGQISRPFTSIYLQLHLPRQVLYQRINQRVDQMLDQGLEEEAKRLFPHREQSALQTVGYQEFFDYFEDKIPQAEAIRLIKRNTRRYAKRQLTWMRRDSHWKHIGPDEWDIALQYIALVREQGLCMEQRSGNDPSLAVLLDRYYTFSKLPRSAVCLMEGKRIAGAAPLLGNRHYHLLVPPVLPEAFQRPGLAELLLHEAIHSTGFSSCFARVPASIEPFLHRFGFETVDRVPPNIEEQFPASPFAGESTVLLFREKIG